MRLSLPELSRSSIFSVPREIGIIFVYCRLLFAVDELRVGSSPRIETWNDMTSALKAKTTLISQASMRLQQMSNTAATNHVLVDGYRFPISRRQWRYEALDCVRDLEAMDDAMLSSLLTVFSKAGAQHFLSIETCLLYQHNLCKGRTYSPWMPRSLHFLRESLTLQTSKMIVQKVLQATDLPPETIQTIEDALIALRGISRRDFLDVWQKPKPHVSQSWRGCLTLYLSQL